jgi:Lhr-like helicase
MGGTISITLRTVDGKEYRMQRRINTFPSFLNNLKFINEDPTHIQDYLKAWLDMKEDYESGKLQLNMTSMYFPSCGLIPDEYGIIVIDMQKKEIIDCFQRYSTIGELFVCSMESIEGENRPIFDALIHWNKIKHCYMYVNQTRVDLKIPTKFDDLIYPLTRLSLDMSPYKITRYEPKQASIALAHIEQLGFKLTYDEKKAWKEFIEEQEEN